MTNQFNTPWGIVGRTGSKCCIADNGGDIILVAHVSDAAHIVRCVNSHDALVAALTEIVADAKGYESRSEFRVSWLDKAEAALTLAQGEQK